MRAKPTHGGAVAFRSFPHSEELEEMLEKMYRDPIDIPFRMCYVTSSPKKSDGLVRWERRRGGRDWVLVATSAEVLKPQR